MSLDEIVAVFLRQLSGSVGREVCGAVSQCFSFRKICGLNLSKRCSLGLFDVAVGALRYEIPRSGALVIFVGHRVDVCVRSAKLIDKEG